MKNYKIILSQWIILSGFVFTVYLSAQSNVYGGSPGAGAERRRGKSRSGKTLGEYLGIHDSNDGGHMYGKKPGKIEFGKHILLEKDNKKYKVGKSESKLNIAPLFSQIVDKVPFREKINYKYPGDFRKDTADICDFLEEKDIDISGLKNFLEKFSAKFAEEDTVYIPMLVMRVYDESGNKIWIVHMNWAESNEISNDPKDIITPNHILTYALSYDDGRVLYIEK